MSDLTTRILATIDRIETIANAVQDNSAPWDGQWKSQRGQVVRTLNDWVLVYGTEAKPLRRGFVEHVAANDPATVLRRCAADRRIIGRHTFGHKQVWDDELSDLRTIEHCVTCTMGNGCDHCITEADNDYEPWPCATLRDLADSYGITVEADTAKAVN